MKNTASNPNATTQHQARDSRQNTGPGAANRREESTNAASASQEATNAAKRGEALRVEKRTDRSPKQENL